jgi:hypothetical protein
LATQLGITNWSRFVIWLVVGLAIYFFYGRKYSKLSSGQNPREFAAEKLSTR